MRKILMSKPGEFESAKAKFLRGLAMKKLAHRLQGLRGQRTPADAVSVSRDVLTTEERRSFCGPTWPHEERRAMACQD